MGERWTKERIWEWYDAHPWIRGCNFITSDCANRIDQWQSLGFEERFETVKKELEVARDTGFNTIRIIPEFIVWYEEHDTFFERFDRYIEAAFERGQSSMIVLGNDCMRPKWSGWEMPKTGPQHYDWGYHGGINKSQHDGSSKTGYHPFLDEPEYVEHYYEFVREIVTRYKNDERVLIWDVYNEPGNCGRKLLTPPHIKKLFEICREIDPIQPLTSGIWCGFMDGELDLHNILYDVQQFAFDNSDIISFHHYGTYESTCRLIKNLKKSGRPLVCTEWLARILHNNVEEIYPLFYLEKVGCYCWGLVAGKTQYNEPWGMMINKYKKDPTIDYDFTKWFHDLYRGNYFPYNPKEIDLIKKFSAYADEDFKEQN